MLGALLHACAAQFPGNAMAHRKLLAEYLASAKIKARRARRRSQASRAPQPPRSLGRARVC